VPGRWSNTGPTRQRQRPARGFPPRTQQTLLSGNAQQLTKALQPEMTAYAGADLIVTVFTYVHVKHIIVVAPE
jgi:hypothetical protein